MSIFRVIGSISTNTGFKPDCIIGHKDVDQQTVGMRTESPFFNLFFRYGFTKH